MQSVTALAQRAGIALLMALPCVALATPPSWAPAHGWRKKNDPTYAGYSGRTWDYDYGVRSGGCDRDRIGQVLGGVVGGVAGGAIGGEVAKGSTERDVAIVVGAVIGAAIGSEIGRRMDKKDRSCVGHSLELAAYGQSVRWTNPNTRVTYQLTPLDAEIVVNTPARAAEETRAIAAYNERLVTDPRLQTTIVPLRDGVAISVKKRE